jgi:hypothetical protein
MLLGKKESTNNANTCRQYILVYLLFGVAALMIASSLHIMYEAPVIPVNAVYGQEDLSTEENASSTSTGSSDVMSSVAFKSNLEQIAGHLNAAMLNKESGNSTLALAHAFHPVAEVYTLIEPAIANANTRLNETLSAELINITDIVRFVSAEEFSDAVQNAKQLLNASSDAVIPSQLNDNATFNVMVIIDLLNTAEAEYGEAVLNDTIAEMVEYQDAQAFISRGIDRAQSLFEQESSEIPQNMSESVQEEVKSMFTDLNNKILSISSPESVGSTIQGIVHELSEIAGIEDTSVASEGPQELISNIRELLDQVVTEYGNQNYNQAEALATEAYLENYEYIEAPLAESDETLMENIEVMLREELRQLIQDRSPLEEIQQQVDMINNNLDDANTLLMEEVASGDD